MRLMNSSGTMSLCGTSDPENIALQKKPIAKRLPPCSFFQTFRDFRRLQGRYKVLDGVIWFCKVLYGVIWGYVVLLGKF